jgi:type IV secretory pathway TrbD component
MYNPPRTHQFNPLGAALVLGGTACAVVGLTVASWLGSGTGDGRALRTHEARMAVGVR